MKPELIFVARVSDYFQRETLTSELSVRRDTVCDVYTTVVASVVADVQGVDASCSVAGR